MAANDNIVSSLVTYGLMSDDNYQTLKDWFEDLFDEIQTNGGSGGLLEHTVAGRQMKFAPTGISTQDMFSAVGRALRILGGRGQRQALKRF